MTATVSAASLDPPVAAYATGEVSLDWGDGAHDTAELNSLGQGSVAHTFQPPGPYTVEAHYKGAIVLRSCLLWSAGSQGACTADAC